MNDNIYYAADTAEKAVGYLSKKSSNWFNHLYHNRYLEKIRKSWMSYHGAYFTDDGGSGHEITFGGEQGELVNMAVNHYQNIAKHMLVMVTSNRPAFQPKATNTDHKTQVQTYLAHGILEYYMREKRLERFIKRAVEYAIVLGSGFIKMEWNSTKGEIYDSIEPDEEDIADYNEEGEPVDENGRVLKPFPIYQGDIEFENLSPYDVVFDNTKETSDNHDWVLTRTFKNKYDLAAKYPEFEDEIKGMQTKDQKQKGVRATLSYVDETVDIPVYEFFHRRTEALPQGRYLLYLDQDVVLLDTPMPYRNLPVYRISPSDILGTPYGYSPMFDLMPMQDAVNTLYSTILTNQNAHGVQSILSPRGNDVKVSQVSEGMNFIEYNVVPNAPGGGKPEALNLTQTPAEIFNFLQMIERAMETVSGVNSVARGNPEASLRSGNALALVQSQALQFLSGLSQQYVQLIEDIGTGIIHLIQDFAKVPRVAEIAGQSNRAKIKEFIGDDVSSITRVLVDSGNPLAQCLGKDTPVLMADGSTKMSQNIEIGDKIMGPDSLPRTVGNVNSGQEEMFLVSPKNNKLDVSYECNRSHVLTLRYCSDDERYSAKKGQEIDITVNDYLNLPERHRKLLQGFTTGVDFEERELGVPAYILGAWLGDGTKTNTSLTTMDSEILKEWCDYADSINMDIRVVDTNNKSKTYFITSGKHSGRSDRNPMMNELRQMEVINNKHIPSAYLINSEKNRLELLAGLIDTDGSLVDSTFIFTQKCEKLTDQVVYLAKSLGFRVTKTLVEREHNSKEANIFKVSIGGDTWKVPTRLPRKQVKFKEKSRNWNNFGINVESLGEGTYYGFTLIEEPHFLLGNFVVTHNTTAGRAEMASNLLQMGLIQTPEEYFAVLNTGKLDPLVQGQHDELLLIKAENERLVEGDIDVLAIDTDNHALHIREHKTVLADPDSRLDAELVARTLAHIQEHIDALREVQPDLLSITGQQPLAPQGGSPVAPGNAAPQQPNQAPPAAMQDPMATNEAGLPNRPKLPQG